MIFVIEKQHTVLAVPIKCPVQASQLSLFSRNILIFVPENQFISCNRNKPKQSKSTAWQITEVLNSEKRHAVNLGKARTSRSDFGFQQLSVIKPLNTV